MSPMLRQILQEWIDWVDAGAPEVYPTATRYIRECQGLTVIPDRDTGLCFFIGQRGSQLRDEQYHSGKWIMAAEHPKYELLDMFREDGLDHHYPFNVDPAEYDKATQLGTHHLNRKRTAWVRAALKAS